MTNKIGKVRSKLLDYYARCFDEDIIFNSSNLPSLIKDIEDQGQEIIEDYGGKVIVHVYKLVKIIEITEETSFKMKEIDINTDK